MVSKARTQVRKLELKVFKNNSMGFFDRITGNREAGSPSDEQSTGAGPSQSEFLAEAVPAASTAQAEQLREAIPAFTPSASPTTSSDGGQRLYNPYEVCETLLLTICVRIERCVTRKSFHLSRRQ